MTYDFTNAPYQHVQLAQGTIRYREIGHGEPLVFIHGLLVNGSLWHKVVPLLAPRFRCIVPDLPLGSHALPMTPAADLTPPGLAQLITDFLAALNLEHVTLVGNDTGGALCQLTITAHPERIARLVLTNCDAFEAFLPLPIRPFQWASYLPGFVWAYAQLLRIHALRPVTVVLALLCKYPVERSLLDGWFSPIRRSAAIRRDLQQVLQGISARYTLAAARVFPTLPQPVLLAWAPQDRVFRLSFARRLQAAFANARLALIHDSYTFSCLDQPQQLATEIEAFVHETALVMA